MVCHGMTGMSNWCGLQSYHNRHKPQKYKNVVSCSKVQWTEVVILDSSKYYGGVYHQEHSYHYRGSYKKPEWLGSLVYITLFKSVLFSATAIFF